MSSMELAKCRTCEATESTNTLFHLKEPIEDYPELLADMLDELIKIDIPDDIAKKLPQYICDGCTGRLLDAQDFVAQAQEATLHLIKLLVKKEPSSQSSEPKIVKEADARSPGTDLTRVKVELESETLVLNEPLDTTNVELKLESNFGDDGSLDDVPLQHFVNTSKANDNIRHSPNKKTFKCDLCDKSYSHSSSLKSHRRWHTGEKPFKCNLCEKTFKISSDLESHQRTHTGERPFKCDLCESSFNLKQALQNHRRTHTGEKPYKCTFCSKDFATSGLRIMHLRTHSGEKRFKCDLCDIAFRHRTSMQRHRRTHTGEKPYECDLCQRTFNTCTHLKIHRRVHTGERPFKCDVCNKRFTERSGMQRHRVRMHKAENSDCTDSD